MAQVRLAGERARIVAVRGLTAKQARVDGAGMIEALTPGARLARGVCRLLRSVGFAPLTEFTLASGLRVDVIGLGPRGEVWIVECKSSRADFGTDRKWGAYLEWGDRFLWAVDAAFPVEILPEDAGLILADAWGAEIMRMGPETPLAPARRRAVTQRFARVAAGRLHGLVDPAASGADLL